MTEPVLQFTRDHGFWLCTVRNHDLLYRVDASTLEGSIETVAKAIVTRPVDKEQLKHLAEVRAHVALIWDAIRNPDGLEG
jgi:hypothetical protein